ncbi:type II toxin-antitoxin system RelE/ParE family toxin [Alkalimonas sp. NCh-2]|uniref:type II toxin-antitoxin system RelE/ParE family toxin n=1 Tax=Alkalimonas sp. NCh-2 TaxID=3144846 RepID=UPI0031F5FA1A
MLPYVLTADAEQDLREVARYTLDRWGSDMLKQYRDGLKEAFHAIATKALPGRTFSSTFPNLLVAKYRLSNIFSQVKLCCCSCCQMLCNRCCNC